MAQDAVISAVFNYTDTKVTDNDQGLLNDRRLTEFAYALPRTRWNIGLTQRMGRMSFLGRVNYYGGFPTKLIKPGHRSRRNRSQLRTECHLGI